MRALILKRGPLERKPVYHDALLDDKPIPALKRGEVLVKIGAAAYNHRDVSKVASWMRTTRTELVLQLWIRKGQYPGIAFDSTFGADGAGRPLEILSL